MKKTSGFRNSIIVLSTLFLTIIFFSKCITSHDTVIADKDGEQFAGAAKCQSCHSDIYAKHLHTAHYLTSQRASDSSIKGSFEAGKNVYKYNEKLSVAMEKRENGFYQTEYLDQKEQSAHRFDISIGSGTRGQNFLYWDSGSLYQLPVAYFTLDNQWSSSPGFPKIPVYNRPIVSRCMECHATFIKKTGEKNGSGIEIFDSTQLIYGITCEKCHGPGAQHVAYQMANPTEKKAQYIINPASLSRQQNIDLCTLCHAGNRGKLQPSFSFKVGGLLSNYFYDDDGPVDPQNIDVHGNQYGLLRLSKCFRKSQTMTCNSCHNVHENERDKIETFSTRCINCHGTEHVPVCKMMASIGASINKDCVNCHMPKKESKTITILLANRDTLSAPYIRSHYISINEMETKAFLTSKKKQ